mgnify:CR=1 FL=1
MFSMLRDKSRDEMAKNLAACGIRAETAERGRAEEQFRSWALTPGLGSKGIINILDGGLIKWINVVKTKHRDRHSGPRYRTVLGIPDESIPLSHKKLKITTVRKKSFPLFGKIVDVYWESKGDLQPLVKVFSDDIDIDKLVTDLGNMSIYTHPNKFRGWTLDLGKIFLPTEPCWAAFQKIADYLLSFPLEGREGPNS